MVDQKYLDENTKYYVNPTGRFVIGGPLGDTGLTRKKDNSRHIWTDMQDMVEVLFLEKTQVR